MIRRPCSGPQDDRTRQVWADAYDKAAQARADLAAALQHVQEHGFGDDVDADSLIEAAAAERLASITEDLDRERP